MDEVELVAYDPAWPTLYALEAERLRAALPPGLILAMEHFGSTAIPGMPAKPIIDILAAVPSVEAARHVAPGPLAALGYAFWAENPKRDRLFFVKGLPPAALRRTHHLHLCEAGGEMWQRLVFRDVLRNNTAEAQRYAALKHALAAAHREDREAYTDGKTAFVAATLAMAARRT